MAGNDVYRQCYESKAQQLQLGQGITGANAEEEDVSV